MTDAEITAVQATTGDAGRDGARGVHRDARRESPRLRRER